VASVKTLTRQLPGKSEKILEHVTEFKFESDLGDPTTHGRVFS